MGRNAVVAVVLLACVAATVSTAVAQSANSWSIGIWYWPDPIPPGWICTIPGQGPYSMLCFVPPKPLPPTSVCPTCGKGGAAAGKPINLTNGNTYVQQTDLLIPGLGNGLTLTRTWNSMWPSTQGGSQIGLFGPNWKSTYEERIFLDSTGYRAYARADGAYWFFALNGSNWNLVSPANVVATMTQGPSYWTIRFQNGEQRRFDNASGSLIAIVDRNGNTTQLAYDAINRLTTVTDPASRHLTFTYADNSSMLVTGVSSDVGITLTYQYDNAHRLSKVIEPDLSTITFEYDANSMLTAVKDADGKILESHTYDERGRGTTSSRANGVESVTISYPN